MNQSTGKPISDRNFDDLANHFNQRIYDTSKGRIRLAILQRDLQEVIPHVFEGGHEALSILDAGAGEGALAMGLAQAGHQVTLCDHSKEMLSRAEQAAQALGVQDRVQCVHSSIQDLPKDLYGQGSAENGCSDQGLYDLVMCHAVMEWVTDPKQLLRTLWQFVKPNGLISLMFFNYHSTVFRSLVRGYLEKALAERFAGSGQGLTPINPLKPDQVMDWFGELNGDILVQSGVRVFHDYMHKDVRDKRDEGDILQLEMRYSRMEPYRSMGRYYHLIGRKL